MILPNIEEGKNYYTVLFKREGKTYGVSVKTEGFEKTGVDINDNFKVLKFIIDFGGVFEKFGVIEEDRGLML